jgi:hypothetical protein
VIIACSDMLLRHAPLISAESTKSWFEKKSFALTEEKRRKDKRREEKRREEKRRFLIHQTFREAQV